MRLVARAIKLNIECDAREKSDVSDDNRGDNTHLLRRFQSEIFERSSISGTSIKAGYECAHLTVILLFIFLSVFYERFLIALFLNLSYSLPPPSSCMFAIRRNSARPNY